MGSVGMLALCPCPKIQFTVNISRNIQYSYSPRRQGMAVIIDQCRGNKATNIIAKYRIASIEGNVDSSIYPNP